ncbi:MAG: class II aldolase [Acidimicrobiales bacterium]|nr:class II aldolase [Acidimicrobiales bacterium]
MTAEDHPHIENSPATTGESELIAVLLDAQRRGLNRGTSGNSSLRTPTGFSITPSALPYDQMTVDDLVSVDHDQQASGRHRPSSEWLFHSAIYAARPDVAAIVHLHSPSATALASLRRDIPAFHYMVAVAGGESIRCGDYATFGTAELAAIAVDALRDRMACLLANHGQIACGDTPRAAFRLAEEVESLAQQFMLASSVAEPAILTPEEMSQVLMKFSDYRSALD